MADLKISQLTAISVLTPATDVLPVVDVGGVTKKITTNQILGSGGTATLASATITGDLTVDTSTLKVDSANDRVGIGTASPAAGAKLGVLGATSVSTSDYIGSSTYAARFIGSSNGASSGISLLTNSAAGQPTPASIHATPIADFRSALTATYSADNTGAGYFAVNRFNPSGSNTLEHYKIDNAGVATWSNVGGVAGTAMTLNANGLGVGTAVQYARLTSSGSNSTGIANIQNSPFASNANTNLSCYIGHDGTANRPFIQAATGNAGNAFDLLIQPYGGNVGIGVTPSAGKGCLQLSSGINFPATQVASSDANTLDDYEEGTWTGTLKGSVSDPTTPVTATGRYTKIGRQVSVVIDFGAFNSTGASGNASIIGLPFTNGLLSVGSVESGSALTFSGTLMADVSTNGTTIQLQSITSNAFAVFATHNAGNPRYLTVSINYSV